MMTTRRCRFCETMLIFIPTFNKTTIPAEAGPIHKTGASELDVKGVYFDERGRRYRGIEVPIGSTVYRSHWDRCPGAAQARRPRKSKTKA